MKLNKFLLKIGVSISVASSPLIAASCKKNQNNEINNDSKENDNIINNLNDNSKNENDQNQLINNKEPKIKLKIDISKLKNEINPKNNW
ncbi:Uncharacterised protein, partial [Metamycoplasma alkalescens]